jgi:membrane protease subunit HflK
VTQVRLEEVPGTNTEKLILTGDQNLVDLSYLIRWNISDLALYKYQLSDPRNALLEIGEAAMRAAVAKQKLDTVLTGEGRAEIEQDVRAAMQARLDAYRSGISVQGIEINKVDPPSRVEEAFKDVSSAQQDADAAINRARAVAQQLLARAQGDASEFNDIYAEYKLAPEVTRRRLYYETMEQILSKTDKTIVESGNVMPYLPLPEVKQRSKAQPARPQGE